MLADVAHSGYCSEVQTNDPRSDIAQVHEVSILQDKVPVLVEGLLEARQADRGLAHNDVVAMIAVLEQLMSTSQQGGQLLHHDTVREPTPPQRPLGGINIQPL